MSSIIELHDSWVAGIMQSRGSVIVRFRPAYIHRSEGRPGVDPGSGWSQDLDLVFPEAVFETTFAEMPLALVDGCLEIDTDVFENTIPFPLDARGTVRFAATSLDGARLIIKGIRATVVPVGEARYVEQFPGGNEPVDRGFGNH